MILKRFFPSYIYDKVEDISYEMLESEDIKAIIFDMDNTLVDYKYKYNDKLKSWIDNMKQKGIKFCILSNTPRTSKIKQVAGDLDMEYINNAYKPWSGGYRRAIKMLDMEKRHVAIAGDQIFTDIWGGNRFGIRTILIKPINTKETIVTKIKRPLERYVLKKFKENKEGEK
jgi:HAD superfamily phosphatase (TIGR01668 family)